MKKSILINIRIDPTLKNDFQDIALKEGTTMSEIIGACITDIVKRGTLPIGIKSKIKSQAKPLLSVPEIKKAIDEIMFSSCKGKIKNVSLFGSYSRGEATKNSDIDLFIDPSDSFTALDLVGLGNDLEKKLGKKVDLIIKGDDVSPSLLSSIKRDAVQIYEEQ